MQICGERKLANEATARLYDSTMGLPWPQLRPANQAFSGIWRFEQTFRNNVGTSLRPAPNYAPEASSSMCRSGLYSAKVVRPELVFTEL